MASVCVGIPVAAAHLRWLPQCLKSVQAQTLRPTRITVYVSSAPCPALDVTVECNSTRSRVPAGIARNRAVEMCGLDVKYVSLIDADDVMMPYALERMVGLMRAHNATVGLHNYFSPGEEVIVRTRSDLERDGLVRVGAMPPMVVKTHHGHVTVRRRSWKEQSRRRRGQDSEFVSEMWRANHTFVHTTEKLTRYLRRPRP